MNLERIRCQVQNAINRLPTEIVLKRIEKLPLEYDGWEEKEIVVTTVNALLDNSKSSLHVALETDIAEVKRVKRLSLIIIYNKTFEVKIGDYFILDGIKHEIIYPKNNYNLYWECDVEVIK